MKKHIRKNSLRQILCIVLLLSPACVSRAGGFPDRLAGWERVDSVTYLGPAFPNQHGVGAAVLEECGAYAIASARYRSGREEVAVAVYRTYSSYSAFALFSAMIGDSIFTGQMGNGVVSMDSLWLIDYGSIVAVLSNPAAPRPYTPPGDLRNAFHDFLIAESNFEVLRLDLPIEERRLGCERSYAGPITARSFHDARFDPIFDGITSMGGFYVADYVKERLPIRRRMLYYPTSHLGAVATSQFYRWHSAGKMTLRESRSGIDWYEHAAGSIYVVVPREKDLYIVTAAKDDTGAMEWLVDLFGK